MKSLLQPRPDRALLLWLGNGLALLLLLAILAWRLAPLLPGSAATIAGLSPLSVPGGEPPLPVPTEYPRNPFDPSGKPWRAAVTAPEPGSAGNVTGVIVLPGVTAVVTDAATVRVGESLNGGTLLRVDGEQMVIDGVGGPTRVDLPGARRPYLKDLNRGAAPACKDSKC